MNLNTHMRWLVFVALATVLLLAAAVPATAQQAIFTSNADGTCVNCNHYDSKTDVYLNGGPMTCGSNTLPDGQYYFQVTDPSGGTVLSSDSLPARVFTLASGIITAASHPTSAGHCGGLSVQLAPFDDSGNGLYKVHVILVSAYDAGCGGTGCFEPSATKTDNFKVLEGGGGGTQELSELTGTKFYDLNTDGVQDPGEPGILGWRIEKAPPTPSDITYTDSNGEYSFFLDSSDENTYTISEMFPYSSMGTWLNTTPMSGSASLTGSSVVDFGNVCLGAGGGKTKGFWTNKNGQGLITAPDLTFLSGLSLRNANGSDFDPGSKSALKNWLQDANAVNMAYMLSAQLAAMELNVRHAFVTGGSLVHSGPDPVGCPDLANDAGFISVSALMTAANSSLGSDGDTPAGDPNRACQEFLKDALDNANNNKNFVQAGPSSCPFTTPY